MKRLTCPGLLLLLLCLLLGGCSRQKLVNADVFLLRLTADGDITAEPLYYDTDSSFCFVTAGGLRAALRLWETEDGYLKKIAVSAAGDSDAAAFAALCRRILQVYAPREPAADLMQALAAGEGPLRYAAGETHRLCAAADKAGRFFSVTDALLAPTQPPPLTLRPTAAESAEQRTNAGD